MRKGISRWPEPGDSAVVLHIENGRRTQVCAAAVQHIVSQCRFSALTGVPGDPVNVDERVRRGAFVDTVKNEVVKRMLPIASKIGTLIQIPCSIEQS